VHREDCARLPDLHSKFKIAGDTAHDLLLNIAAEMKVRYTYEEARHVFQEVE
jgi:hypothetical protein